MTKAGVVLAGILLALSVLVPSASAATRTVHLTDNGPSPAALTIKAGDRVVFVNDDTVPHQVRSQGGWQYDSGPIPPRQTSDPTPALTAPGTYRYTDVRGIVFLPQTFLGTLTVPAPRPTRSPTASPTVSPTVSPTPHPTRTPPPPTSPRPAPVVTAPPAPGPTRTPGPGPTRSAVPLPTPPGPSSTPVPDIRYGDPQALVQPSPHRYGLPAVLAGVALAGVLSLLVRYLLALPEGRRTGSG